MNCLVCFKQHPSSFVVAQIHGPGEAKLVKELKQTTLPVCQENLSIPHPLTLPKTPALIILTYNEPSGLPPLNPTNPTLL